MVREAAHEIKRIKSLPSKFQTNNKHHHLFFLFYLSHPLYPTRKKWRRKKERRKGKGERGGG